MVVSFGVGNGMPKKPYKFLYKILENNSLNRTQWAFPEKKYRLFQKTKYRGLKAWNF